MRALLIYKREVVRVASRLVYATSDERGEIRFSNVPGGIYHVETENGLRIKGKIWRLKDSIFTIVGHRRRGYKRIKRLVKHYIIESKGK